MYNLPYFKEKDHQKVMEFIQKHPFAFVAGCDEDQQPVATQIPLFPDEVNGRLYLKGHMMRQTDHHKAFELNNSVLCVFTGPHTYVSATWYANPHQASTWNYMSVHVKGKMNFLDEKGLIDVLRRTTLHFENYNQQSTTVYDNLPEDYRSRLIRAIIAFEIEIEQIDNVFKLSQNRDQESYRTIMEKLKAQSKDGELIAGEMKQREDQLFTTPNQL